MEVYDNLRKGYLTDTFLVNVTEEIIASEISLLLDAPPVCLHQALQSIKNFLSFPLNSSITLLDHLDV